MHPPELSTQPIVREMLVPLRAAEVKQRGLKPSQVEPAFFRDRRVRGAYVSSLVTRQVEVPAWAAADSLWWELLNDVAVLLCTRPHALVTGNTAAYIRGLPVHVLNTIDLAVASKGGVIRLPFVNTHRHQNTRYAVKAGIKFHDLTGILTVIASQESVTSLVCILDALMGPWLRSAELTRETLDNLVTSVPRVEGRARLVKASELARPGVASPRETHLRLALVNAGLPEPTVAHPIYIPKFGRYVHPDLAYEFAKLALEYEGDQHFSLTDNVQRDIERYYELQRLGWTVIRVTRLHSFDEIVKKVRAFLYGS